MNRIAIKLFKNRHGKPSASDARIISTLDAPATLFSTRFTPRPARPAMETPRCSLRNGRRAPGGACSACTLSGGHPPPSCSKSRSPWRRCSPRLSSGCWSSQLTPILFVRTWSCLIFNVLSTRIKNCFYSTALLTAALVQDRHRRGYECEAPARSQPRGHPPRLCRQPREARASSIQAATAQLRSAGLTLPSATRGAQRQLPLGGWIQETDSSGSWKPNSGPHGHGVAVSRMPAQSGLSPRNLCCVKKSQL